MEKITGNEPAMPILNEPVANDGYGLTIRQEIAARLMQGLITESYYKSGLSDYDYAATAVRLTDILINELNR